MFRHAVSTYLVHFPPFVGYVIPNKLPSNNKTCRAREPASASRSTQSQTLPDPLCLSLEVTPAPRPLLLFMLKLVLQDTFHFSHQLFLNVYKGDQSSFNRCYFPVTAQKKANITNRLVKIPL